MCKLIFKWFLLVIVILWGSPLWAQYTPIPLNLSGPNFRAAIDQRFNGTSSITSQGAIYPFGTVSSGTKTCPTGYAICTITLSGNVTLSGAPPSVTTNSASMVWQITQDATGGHTVIWDATKFRFDNPSNIALVINTFPSKTEQYTFTWNSALSIWEYQARSGSQQWPITEQGNSDAIGCVNGNSDSATVCSIPANVWTSVANDNGGFIPNGGGGGVALYAYFTFSEITLCNYNSSTEFFSTYCLINGTYRRASPDREIDGSQCLNISFSNELNGIPSSLFSSFYCFVDPTNTLTVLHSNEFTNEIPQD